MSDKVGRKVVVTTEFRGVFFGTLQGCDGNTATLTEIRNCIYWTTEVRGFLGLATTGPLKGCRVGPAASEVELMGITSISLCSDDAIEKWEAGPWS